MRRTKVVTCCCVTLAWLVAISCFAQNTIPKTYEKVKVAEGVYAFIAEEPKTEIVSGNSVAVIGDDGVLVVDTMHFPSLTRRMIADIKQLTDKPVRYVVNTHWHPDHLMGNGEYKQAFPDVVILSTPSTREQMESQVPTTYIRDTSTVPIRPAQSPSKLPAKRSISSRVL